MRLTMAQALISFLDSQYLMADGKEYKFFEGIFGIFGHGNVVGLGEAIVEGNHNLTFYQGHSEQGMAHAAIAFAKQRDRRSTCVVSSSVGPGALNMLTAAGTASANRIPVLFLPGDVFVSRQPDPVLQQIENSYDPNTTANDAFRAVSRYWDRISRPEQLISSVVQAMRVLTDPADTGAVTISLPQDVQGEVWDYPEDFLEKRVHHLMRMRPSQNDLQAAADLIRRKKKPLIICGGGVRYSAAEKELMDFAVSHNIPFSESQAGKGVINYDHSHNLGGIGVTGSSASNRLAQQADLIIPIGCRMNDFITASKWLFQNPECSFLAINANRYDACKMNALPLTGDAASCLSDLHEAIGNYNSSWGTSIRDEIEIWNTEVDKLYAVEAKEKSDGENLLPQTRVLGMLNDELLQDDDVIVCAAGSLPGDLQRLWRARSRGSYHLEYGFSCMGYEVAGAMGAKLAEPEREVYALVGDGSYVMLHSELLTSMREGLKITVILFDNCGFHCIDNLQTSQGISSYGNKWRARGKQSKLLDAPMHPVDYAKNAESYGLKGMRATTVAEFKRCFAEARNCSHSVLIDVKVEEKSMTGGYDVWWRVGTPGISEKPAVMQAHKSMQENISKSRQY